MENQSLSVSLQFSANRRDAVLALQCFNRYFGSTIILALWHNNYAATTSTTTFILDIPELAIRIWLFMCDTKFLSLVYRRESFKSFVCSHLLIKQMIKIFNIVPYASQCQIYSLGGAF